MRKGQLSSRAWRWTRQTRPRLHHQCGRHRPRLHPVWRGAIVRAQAYCWSKVQPLPLDVDFDLQVLTARRAFLPVLLATTEQRVAHAHPRGKLRLRGSLGAPKGPRRTEALPCVEHGIWSSHLWQADDGGVRSCTHAHAGGARCHTQQAAPQIGLPACGCVPTTRRTCCTRCGPSWSAWAAWATRWRPCTPSWRRRRRRVQAARWVPLKVRPFRSPLGAVQRACVRVGGIDAWQL